jgi:uncharacterized protein (TIGR00251 family)
MDEYISKSQDGILLRVILHPRASKTAIVGIYRDMLKVQVTAPPIDDSANEMLIELLSDVIKVPRSSIKIAIGKTSRQKILKINSNNLEQIKMRIEEIILSNNKKKKEDDDNIGQI